MRAPAEFLNKLYERLDRYDRYFLIVLSSIFVFGFGYRLLFVGDDNFDTGTFVAYSVTALLLRLISRLQTAKLSKYRTTNNQNARRYFQEMKLSFKCWYVLIAAFIGMNIPLLLVFPLMCVTIPPILALLGFGAAYRLIESLGWGLFCGPAPTLAVLIIWFLVGSAILRLEIVTVNNYWKRAVSNFRLS
jgi:hypothetical protein